LNDNQTEELVNATLMIEQHLSNISNVMSTLLALAQIETNGEEDV
tara:strand:- start:28784 stop:28918 length:135 start_codon:yes stop_codon:yes gene_type:complete